MSILERIEGTERDILAEEIAKALAKGVRDDAVALSARNELTINSEKKRQDAEDDLKRHSREHDVVKFIEQQAAAQGTDIKQYLEGMPVDMRTMYEQAFGKIQGFLEALKGETEPLDVRMLAAGYNGHAALYLPVLWDERQKGVLPGAVYGATLLAGTTCAQELEAQLSEPEELVIEQGQKGIVTLQLTGKDSRQTVDDVVRRLKAADLSELDKAKVRLHADLVSLTERAVDITGGYTAQTTQTGEPQEAYTLSDAAIVWREHEMTRGTGNGTEMNYKMKLGRRASEGRLMTQADGTVTHEALEEFMLYCDARKELTSRRKQKDKHISIDETADLLGVDRSSIVRYVREENMRSGPGDTVSINSVLNFTADHARKGGRWRKYRNPNHTNGRTEPEPMTGHRNDYLTTTEASEAYGCSTSGLLKAVKRGELSAYHDGNKRKFLLDKQELADRFSE
ncbi:MAG: helix-turn-helix domain-containing protein [Planctomycetota bacterium]|jgi:excisionase family DNA binding protein